MCLTPPHPFFALVEGSAGHAKKGENIRCVSFVSLSSFLPVFRPGWADASAVRLFTHSSIALSILTLHSPHNLVPAERKRRRRRSYPGLNKDLLLRTNPVSHHGSLSCATGLIPIRQAGSSLISPRAKPQDLKTLLPIDSRDVDSQSCHLLDPVYCFVVS